MQTYDPVIDNDPVIDKAYKMLASYLNDFRNCCSMGSESRHRYHIEKLIDSTAPRGSGIDNGTKISIDDCTDDKMVFTFEFHHRNEDGSYCGWESYKLIVRPDFQGINLKIIGKNKNYVKDYLYDVYRDWLESNIEHIYNRIDDSSTFKIIYY